MHTLSLFLTHTHTQTHSYTHTETFCCLLPQITSRVGGVGGAKWHCSLNDPEQMSLSQRQTAPKPFGIKLGHTQREGETNWRRKESENTNGYGETQTEEEKEEREND